MIQKLLRNLAQELDKNEIPYMIIGGQAVLIYGTPRLTRDIDITLGVDIDSLPIIKNICNTLQLKILPEKPEQFTAETHVLPATQTDLDIRIDFIFSFTPYEQQALDRINLIEIDDYKIKFASIEDLIIHKMFAGRAIDEEDIKNILIKNNLEVDNKYIKKWLSEFSTLPGKDQLMDKFNTILNSLKKI